VASKEQCEAALQSLARRLGGVDPAVRERHSLDRRLAVVVPDLGTSWSGRLRDGQLTDVVEGGEKGQITFTTSSDDLVALTEGRLSFPSAWASGRLKVDAGVRDLLRLRSLL